MVRLAIPVLFCAALGLSLTAQERIDLSSPETKVSTSTYRFERLTITYDDPGTASVDEGQILLQFVANNGDPLSCAYSATTNPTATFLNNALNKANLSTAYAGNATTGSLKQRVCHRLVVMGEATAICGKVVTASCAGTVP